MLDAELKSKINKLWNAFWAGGLSNPLSAIEQISYHRWDYRKYNICQ